VAIKTTYASLREEIPAFIEMGVVRYLDYATERLPAMNMFEYIMHKDSYFHSEREVRAVALSPNVARLPVEALGAAEFRENHFESATTPGFLVYAPPVNLARMVHGIVLHPDSTPAFEAAMADLCAKNALPQPVASRRNRKPVF
jgi:hypothetical protein